MRALAAYVLPRQQHVLPATGVSRLTAANSTRPITVAPSSPEGEQPFLLIALAGLSVSYGVMYNEDLSSPDDFLVGDGLALKNEAVRIPANRVQEGDTAWIELYGVDVGARRFVVENAVELTLMSADADLAFCQYVEDRSGTRGFLLVPADFKTSACYEVIARS